MAASKTKHVTGGQRAVRQNDVTTDKQLHRSKSAATFSSSSSNSAGNQRQQHHVTTVTTPARVTSLNSRDERPETELPERVMFLRYRHVYAGKGGWFGCHCAQYSPRRSTESSCRCCARVRTDVLLTQTSQDKRDDAAGQQDGAARDTRRSATDNNNVRETTSGELTSQRNGGKYSAVVVVDGESKTSHQAEDNVGLTAATGEEGSEVTENNYQRTTEELSCTEPEQEQYGKTKEQQISQRETEEVELKRCDDTDSTHSREPVEVSDHINVTEMKDAEDDDDVSIADSNNDGDRDGPDGETDSILAGESVGDWLSRRGRADTAADVARSISTSKSVGLSAEAKRAMTEVRLNSTDHVQVRCHGDKAQQQQQLIKTDDVTSNADDVAELRNRFSNLPKIEKMELEVDGFDEELENKMVAAAAIAVAKCSNWLNLKC